MKPTALKTAVSAMAWLALSIPALSISGPAHAQAHGGAAHGAAPAALGHVRLDFASEIPNIPGKSLKTVVVDYAPGFGSPSHTHAPSAFILAYVLEGSVISAVGGQPERVYRAGEHWTEAPGDHHGVSRNASATEPAKLLAIFVVDSTDQELTIPDGR